jgi:protein-S-isoprenylcysteine O-methyltransferase Ste14
MSIRWKNFPIPEAHVTTLITAIALHLVIPVHLPLRLWVRHIPGWGLLVTGVLLAGWSVMESGETELEATSHPISTGPYALSRNPMYMAWTLINIGIALLVNTVWVLICLPAALIATHREIQHEEQQLEKQFGNQYRSYKMRVRRYL